MYSFNDDRTRICMRVVRTIRHRFFETVIRCHILAICQGTFSSIVKIRYSGRVLASILYFWRENDGFGLYSGLSITKLVLFNFFYTFFLVAYADVLNPINRFMVA